MRSECSLLAGGRRSLALSVILLASVAGCARPNLGDSFVTARHSVVSPDSAKVVVYLGEDVDPAIYYYLKIDGKTRGKVFHGTFFSQVVEPGTRTIVAMEYWTGKGLGKELSPGKVFSMGETETEIPDSLHAGARTPQDLQISPGEVIFLRLTKRQGEEFFYACRDTRDTTTMCRGVRFDSAFEVVSAATAGQQLLGRQESL